MTGANFCPHMKLTHRAFFDDLSSLNRNEMNAIPLPNCHEMSKEKKTMHQSLCISDSKMLEYELRCLVQEANEICVLRERQTQFEPDKSIKKI